MPALDREVLPTNVRPIHYDLQLTPDLDKLVFDGTVAVKLEVLEATSTITLNAEDLKITAAYILQDVAKTEQKLASNSIAYQADTQSASIAFAQGLPANSTITLVLHFTGVLNDLMAGFYRSSYTNDKGEKRNLAVTQFEPTDARRAFPCWDEPSLKATFDVTLNVPADLTALSNMNVVSETPLEDLARSYKQVKFATTPIMSTYLLAFVVGDLEYIETHTAERPNESPIKCRVYTLKGLKEQGRFALDVAARTLDVLADTFDIPYPLPKLDLVAIPDFEAGAMENWGLVTYRTSALLFDEKSSTTQAKQYVAYVIAHENSHQWFGNLCTMEWWSDLWLNEGFATWVGNYAVDKLFPEWNVWTSFVMEEFQRGLSLDAMRSSHPIEVDVRRASEISQIFDAISYSKGASVIRMLSSYLGEDVFLAGVRAYLKKHMYKNASTRDLWQALSETSGQEVSHFMELWTRHVGYPVVSVNEEPAPATGTAATRQIKVTQSRFLSTGDVKPEDDQVEWWVPLSVVHSEQPKTPSHDILTQKQGTFSIPASASYYILNYQQTGVYRVHYPLSAIEALGRLMEADRSALTTIDRLGIVADAASLNPPGISPTTDFLTLLKSYEAEPEFVIWSEISLRLSEISSLLYQQPESVRDHFKAFVRRLFRQQHQRLGWEYPEGEDPYLARLRSLVILRLGLADDAEVLTEARRRFQLFFEQNNESAVPPNLRTAVFNTVIGHGGAAELKHVMKFYESATVVDQKNLALSAIGAVREPALITQVLDYAISDKVRNQDMHILLNSLGSNTVARHQAWAFVKQHWSLFVERYKASMMYLGTVAKVVAQTFSTPDMAAEVEKFFSDKDISKINRAVNQTLEKIRLNSAWLARDKDVIAKWLGENAP
ncbi:peptidase family M1-domain-containing protein [Dimargaris cristalligena]|uniref:Aminopeptidase n=1 Tax=Dimargaris cristalligena TaxID=215637 RepID=A0A4V1J5L4_9FUNG|nr:peptidase family M1-domain-containing protein [Dimargaris cristalligena]|eukprot:RKP39469.1 peptidase family M1-domain-containing protein [Dimargaris cristalligena]